MYNPRDTLYNYIKKYRNKLLNKSKYCHLRSKISQIQYINTIYKYTISKTLTVL